MSSNNDENLQIICKMDRQPNDSSSSSNNKLNNVENDDLFEKIKCCLFNIHEHEKMIRMIMAKINAQITSSDHAARKELMDEIIRKHSTALENLIAILKNCKDNIVICSLLDILRECVSSKAKKLNLLSIEKTVFSENRKILISRLIKLDVEQTLINILSNTYQLECSVAKQITQNTLLILSQIAAKDQKFTTKIELPGSIKIFHILLEKNYNRQKMLLSILIIIKYLVKNDVTGTILIQDGISLILEKLLKYIGYVVRLKLLIVVEIFKYLTTYELYCLKFVNFETVRLLLGIFRTWNNFDGMLRYKIINSTLISILHLSSFANGREFIKSNNGLQLLLDFSFNCPRDRMHDSLLLRISDIINQCSDKTQLSLPEQSPVQFTVPKIKMNSQMDSRKRYNINESDKFLESLYDWSNNSDIDTEYHCRDRFENMENSVKQEYYEQLEKDYIRYSYYFQELNNLEMNTLGQIKSAFNDSKVEINIFRKLLKFKKLTSKEIIYYLIANEIKSVISFCKIAYPDIVHAQGLIDLESLNIKDRNVCRSKIISSIDRCLHSFYKEFQVVYDLDDLMSKNPEKNYNLSFLSNDDEIKAGKSNKNKDYLCFESRFEGGNLRKVIKIGPNEYELILTPDVNSDSQHQWFYFEISNMKAERLYTFNIINCEKTNSQFNFGMKPILFSVIEAIKGHASWVRCGTDICYYRNFYHRSGKGKNYLTTSFSLHFPHSNDICYLAYHFPYTYSQLLTSLWMWSCTIDPAKVYCRIEKLCETLNGNENPLITITAPNTTNNPIKKRKLIFLTARVHPGESNSSWIMQGTLKTLLGNSDCAILLRKNYVFKIVPMLNIEGVINGCNRYALTNQDLNRLWNNPNLYLHPTIYHTKNLMKYCNNILMLSPFIFVDYHGHSRRKNVFLLGCSRLNSWRTIDRACQCEKSVEHMILSFLMQKTSSAFAFSLCSYKVERNKESTARVAIWRQLGINRSYTLESSFCGCDQGPYSGYHFNTIILQNIGNDFCKALELISKIDENSMINLSKTKYCCPLQCIYKSSRKYQKCIQDKHAMKHILSLS